MPTRICVTEQNDLPPRSPDQRYNDHFSYGPSLILRSADSPFFLRQSSSVSSTQRRTPVPSHPIKVSSIPKRNRKKQQHFNNGPKWIHRQGLINEINYHWVETIDANDDDIDAKNKPLVILLHGFPQFWYCWRNQLMPLSEAGYHVVAPDLRGFNLTDKPTAEKRKTGFGRELVGREEIQAAYDMETLTNDILDLMLFLGHNKTHIVGHDWGGIIAWAFAARFPEHTERLVVMNAPHLCRWRDVATDYSSASCCQQAWWTCWYSMCCQLLPSWIPETVLSYQRSWLLTSTMTASAATSNILACTSATSWTAACTVPEGFHKPEGFPTPTGEACMTGAWKRSDMDLYRDAISQPGAIYALLEYYRNLWLSIQQMEHYGKINGDMPILVLWGQNDKTFPKEQYAQGWDDWIEQGENGNNVIVSYLDCGHFTPEEQPEEVNRQLLHFFRQERELPDCRGEI